MIERVKQNKQDKHVQSTLWLWLWFDSSTRSEWTAAMER